MSRLRSTAIALAAGAVLAVPPPAPAQASTDPSRRAPPAVRRLPGRRCEGPLLHLAGGASPGLAGRRGRGADQPVADPGPLERRLRLPGGPAPSTPRETDSAFLRIVLPGYFEAMGMPLAAGRDIADSDSEGSPRVLVVSETMAQALFPSGDALGRQLVVDLGELTTFEVVGVVRKARLTSLRRDPSPAMYAALAQYPTERTRIALRTSGDPLALVGPLRDVLRRMDRDVPLAEPATMASIVARSVSDDRVTTASLALFASIAMLLAAVGLYGVLAYYVSQRRHEIGVRMALGASASDLLRWVLGRGFALVGLGLALGLGGALATTRLMRQLLFETPATEPATFLAVSAFFCLVAYLACLVPARRATRVDPVRALHAD